MEEKIGFSQDDTIKFNPELKSSQKINVKIVVKSGCGSSHFGTTSTENHSNFEKRTSLKFLSSQKNQRFVVKLLSLSLYIPVFLLYK